MLNQVTRALSALLKPIATRAMEQSSQDRDAMGQAYENLHQQKQKQETSNPESEKKEEKAPQSAQVIAIKTASNEELAEARKNEIGSAEVWFGLRTSLEEQKAAGDHGQNSGPSAYEKANAGTSKVATAKKGVILDKKAA